MGMAVVSSPLLKCLDDDLLYGIGKYIILVNCI
jgi:hypothetical protein